MSLRHAVLGVLSSMPMSGYDMQRYFDEAGYFWPASHAQVYQELRKMERDGFIEATIAPRGSKAEKRIYNLTETGHRELQMMTVQPYAYPPERDGMRLQFMYLDLVPFEVAREHLRAHISHHKLSIQHLQGRIDGIVNRRSSLLQSRLKHRPEASHAAIVEYRVHALSAHVARSEAEIAWAERGLELVERLEEQRSTESGSGKIRRLRPAR
jgi:PadR family transcriptional regulator, regulatory protein AphA